MAAAAIDLSFSKPFHWYTYNNASYFAVLSLFILSCFINRVCVNPTSWCGTCHFCTRGNPQFCIKEAMHTAHGFFRDGGFQEYCRLSSHLCYVLPTTMELKQGILCQPLSEICRGWDNMEHYESDAKILVCGAGIKWLNLFFVIILYNSLRLIEP